MPTFSSVAAQLINLDLPTPVHVGSFTCHLLISFILQRIWFFREMSNLDSSLENQENQKGQYMAILRRWQVIWQNEPQASVSPSNPSGRVHFNSTAQLRLAYIWLNSNFDIVRSAFLHTESASDITDIVVNLSPVSRSSSLSRCALHACLALQVPVNMGLNSAARVGLWSWSVQHLICYFECALFLCKWLQIVDRRSDLSANESYVLDFLVSILKEVPEFDSQRKRFSLCAIVAGVWAKLLGSTAIWSIQPKMAEVLNLYADKLKQGS